MAAAQIALLGIEIVAGGFVYLVAGHSQEVSHETMGSREAQASGRSAEEVGPDTIGQPLRVEEHVQKRLPPEQFAETRDQKGIVTVIELFDSPLPVSLVG